MTTFIKAKLEKSDVQKKNIPRNYRFIVKSQLFHELYFTRMTTFIKTKFKILDDQTNIDKYRLAAM